MDVPVAIFHPRHDKAVQKPLLQAETLLVWRYISDAFYKRRDIALEEDIIAPDRQQKGVNPPCCLPGRFSLREPLVHATDNWALDRVLDPA
ncbi:hypothetical protein JYK14_03820 [Siccirubricoccus sp. KC 17139]|uniref:Uncharacterized protein n=1 Tax=Siccirubricoccus soli TaxID=2899147 RepID=A0ABT1D2S6_9PROT|nr:hypothetical protein [Siccirubricoccus soli]MCO6415305.1 hypothetical protein [Siccirubricoccus soli]MCP2681436.1 hypothetical protein [Siccirubricoccus soli]